MCTRKNVFFFHRFPPNTICSSSNSSSIHDLVFVMSALLINQFFTLFHPPQLESSTCFLFEPSNIPFFLCSCQSLALQAWQRYFGKRVLALSVPKPLCDARTGWEVTVLINYKLPGLQRNSLRILPRRKLIPLPHTFSEHAKAVHCRNRGRAPECL